MIRASRRLACWLFVPAIGAVSWLCASCADRCQMNDPRTQCNAYGAPDIGKDAGFVSASDASDGAAE